MFNALITSNEKLSTKLISEKIKQAETNKAAEIVTDVGRQS